MCLGGLREGGRRGWFYVRKLFYCNFLALALEYRAYMTGKTPYATDVWQLYVEVYKKVYIYLKCHFHLLYVFVDKTLKAMIL